MATYAAGLENTNGTPFQRALNLSAPPMATPVNGTMTAATYLAGPPAWFNSTTIRNVYGLVSANDMRYNNHNYGDSYFGAAWKAMGFVAGNNDYEWDMNCTYSMNPLCQDQNHNPITTLQGLNCQGTPSNNLVTFAAQSVEAILMAVCTGHLPVPLVPSAARRPVQPQGRSSRLPAGQSRKLHHSAQFLRRQGWGAAAYIHDS